MTKKEQRQEFDWAIEAFPGWKKQILACEACLDALGARLEQIKEKFGELRVYHWGHKQPYYTPYGPEYIIAQMENDTSRTCYICGEKGKTSSWGGYWLYTMCDKHGNEWSERNRKRAEELKKRAKNDTVK